MSTPKNHVIVNFAKKRGRTLDELIDLSNLITTQIDRRRVGVHVARRLKDLGLRDRVKKMPYTRKATKKDGEVVEVKYFVNVFPTELQSEVMGLIIEFAMTMHEQSQSQQKLS